MLVAKGVSADPVLLVMMCSAEAHAENIMRPKTYAGIRGRAQMRKVDRTNLATRDAATMRFDPAPVPRPDLLYGWAHPQLWPLQPVGQPHDPLSASCQNFDLVAVTVGVALKAMAASGTAIGSAAL